MVEFLDKLARKKEPDKILKAIKKASQDDMKKLVASTTRIMRKEIPVKKSVRAAIMKNRRLLRHIIHPKYSLKSKRRYLLQRGGFLGFIPLIMKAAMVGGRAAMVAARVAAAGGKAAALGGKAAALGGRVGATASKAAIIGSRVGAAAGSAGRAAGSVGRAAWQGTKWLGKGLIQQIPAAAVMGGVTAGSYHLTKPGTSSVNLTHKYVDNTPYQKINIPVKTATPTIKDYNFAKPSNWDRGATTTSYGYRGR